MKKVSFVLAQTIQGNIDIPAGRSFFDKALWTLPRERSTASRDVNLEPKEMKIKLGYKENVVIRDSDNVKCGEVSSR